MDLKKLTENKPSQFFFQAGDAPYLESVYAVGLYIPADGTICYMHHVISTSDSPKLDPKTVENEAISNAKEFGYNTDDLEVIHIDDLDLTSAYRVNVKTKKLEKIPLSEISPDSKVVLGEDNAKQT